MQRWLVRAVIGLVLMTSFAGLLAPDLVRAADPEGCDGYTDYRTATPSAPRIVLPRAITGSQDDQQTHTHLPNGRPIATSCKTYKMTSRRSTLRNGRMRGIPIASPSLD